MSFVFALVAVLAYTLMQVCFKHVEGHERPASPLVLTAWLGALTPFWFLMLGLGTQHSLLVLDVTPVWAGWTVLWAVCTFAVFPLMMLLLQRLSLTELTASRKALITLFALGMDVWVLHQDMKLMTLAACGIILGSSVTLGIVREKDELPVYRDAGWGTAGLVLLLAMTMSLQLLAYKEGLRLQPDTFAHVAAAKGLAGLLSLALFLLPSVRKAPLNVPPRMVALVLASFFVGSVTEAFALNHLSLTEMVAVSLTAPALFALHDVIRGDLPRSPQVFVLLACIFLGFGALFL